jgi:hypothetical protein
MSVSFCFKLFLKNKDISEPLIATLNALRRPKKNIVCLHTDIRPYVMELKPFCRANCRGMWISAKLLLYPILRQQRQEFVLQHRGLAIESKQTVARSRLPDALYRH